MIRISSHLAAARLVVAGVLLSELPELARASRSASELRLAALDDDKAKIPHGG